MGQKAASVSVDGIQFPEGLDPSNPVRLAGGKLPQSSWKQEQRHHASLLILMRKVPK